VEVLHDELKAEAHAIVVMRDGTVWVATNNGVAKFDGRNWNYSNPSTNAQIAATPDGSLLWLLTDAQLSRFDGNVWQAYTLPSEYRSKNLELHTSAVGIAWLVAKDESRWPTVLIRFDGEHWQKVVISIPDKFKPGLEAQHVALSLLGIDSEDRPWFSIVVLGTPLTYYWSENNLVKAPNDFGQAVFWPDGSLWASIPGSRFYSGRTSHWSYLTTGICQYKANGEQTCYMIGETGSKVPCDGGELQIKPNIKATSSALIGAFIRSFSVATDNVASVLAIADYDYLDDTTLCPNRVLKEQLALIRLNGEASERFNLVSCEYDTCASLPFGSIKQFAPSIDNRSVWIVSDGKIGRLMW
jgi:hypothetical protein